MLLPMSMSEYFEYKNNNIIWFDMFFFIGFRQIDSKMCFGYRTCRLADEFIGNHAYKNTGSWHVASNTWRRCFKSRSVAHLPRHSKLHSVDHTLTHTQLNAFIHFGFMFFIFSLHCCFSLPIVCFFFSLLLVQKLKAYYMTEVIDKN